MTPETFENTFAPVVNHDRLSTDQIIAAMGVGGIHPADLPPDVEEAVGAEMKRREGKRPMTPTRFLTLVLGTMGEIKYDLRLQKYVFLADNQFSQARHGRKTTDLMYDWKPHHYGPFSKDLNACVRALSKAKVLEAFKIHESNKDPGVGYRLTIRGNAKFRRLLQNLKDESVAIHGLLEKFQHDYTEKQLIDFVYQMYPEYTTKSLIRDKHTGTGGGIWPCRGALCITFGS